MDSSSNPPFFVQSSNSAQSEGNAGAGPSGDSYSQALHMQAVPPQRGFGPLVNVGGSKAARAGSPLRDVKLEPGSARPATYRSSHSPQSLHPSTVPRPLALPTEQKPSVFASPSVSSRATSVGIPDSVNGFSSGPPMGSGLASTIQSRSDPPRRLIDVDVLPVGDAPMEVVKATPHRNVLLLQGDPQVISKQRVETAIRVIMDLIRSIPSTPTSAPLPPDLFNILPADNTLANLSLERVGCFSGLRLQLGTTTKATAKKQLQAGKTPERELLYLDAAVYKSEEGGRRVYACKRCRLRELRRRASKDASRKKPSLGGEAITSMPQVLPSGATPGPDYITGANPDQYDPHRQDQVVEEPGFDPDRSDWRHEIVLFNSAPEMPIKDGSCMWLPFRVVCYGKCHGEKVGFKIKFTLRTIDGAAVFTATTDPIRITDDHKTDKNPKPKVVSPAASQAQPAVPRPRKGRASAASSRRQSPVASDAESGQSLSEAGAMMQKQTPSVRSKPYERPTTHSPAVSIGGLPFDFNVNGTGPAPPRFHRQHSASSVHSLTSLTPLNPPPNAPPTDTGVNLGLSSARPTPADFINLEPLPVTGTVSPGALRHPNFAMSNFDSYNYSSRPHSAASSNVASPVNGLRPLGDDVMMHGSQLRSLQPNPLSNAFASLNAISAQQQQQQQSLMLSDYLADQDMAHTLNSAMDGLFDASSHSSSFNDDASGFSGYRDSASGLFSESGLVPDTGMEFLDFSGGEDQGLAQPAFDQVSPVGGAPIPPLFDLELSHSPIQSQRPQPNFANIPPQPQPTEDQLRQMLMSFGSQAQAQAQPVPPQPVVSHVIPAEGPLGGGVQIAVAGQRFVPGMTVMFGGRAAKTMVISDSFCTCELPAGPEPGFVEVSVQGAIVAPGQTVEQFRYQGMDKEMMRLALEVRDQYSGSSSDAAYRLAQRVAQSSHSGNSSDRSSASPMASGASPTYFNLSTTSSTFTTEDKEDDLQLTVINFLASIDEHAPGSLRRSGAINTRNTAQQTLLHIATVSGYHRLVRRLLLMGAQVDLQDVNGFTALSFAALCGQVACARVLIEAGAAYDLPTAFGEMPLDLAKSGEKEGVEALLLSAVWSTSSGTIKTDTPALRSQPSTAPAPEPEKLNEVDNDNPSTSGSDTAGETPLAQPSARRLSPKARGKQRETSTRSSPRASPPRQASPPATADVADLTPLSTSTAIPLPPDSPPPYEPGPNRAHEALLVLETKPARGESSTVAPPAPAFHTLVELLWKSLPLHLLPAPLTELLDEAVSPDGWAVLPPPTWGTLYKLTSPDEVKLFTQALAVQFLNVLVQHLGGIEGLDLGDHSRASIRPVDGEEGQGEGSNAVAENGKKRGKRGMTRNDTMLYLFWLPVLMFVGFWLFVTALPIVAGLFLIYGRQMTSRVK